MTKEEQLTEKVQKLHKAMERFIEACPAFEGDGELVKEIGVSLANVETTLHWEFGCWELGLPTMR